MKLSEAILLGSIGTEQAFGHLIREGKTCAMGAAYVAEGIQLIPYSSTKVEQEHHYSTWDHSSTTPLTWKWDYSTATPLAWKWAFVPTGAQRLIQIIPCSCSINVLCLVDIIVHLNDQHKWSRPRIAAWVAEQERLFLPTKVTVIEESLLTSTSCGQVQQVETSIVSTL